MSRKSLLLIAAAVISIPALTTGDAFARSVAGHSAMPVSKPHVSTFKPAGKVVAPRVVSYPKVFGQSKAASGKASASSGGPYGQVLDKAKKIGEDAAKAANGNAPASSGGPYGQVLDKAKKIGEDAAKAAQAAAEKAAREAAEAKAKLQTPGGKLGSQIPLPPPPPPPPPAPTPQGKPDGGYRPHFPAPGGVVVFGSGVSIDPVVVQPGPVVANSTMTARTATSRVADAVTVGTTTPRPNPCNCLVKERLADGSVLFTDICTKESARSVPTTETATPRDAQ